jgi:hypothetical protein
MMEKKALKESVWLKINSFSGKVLRLFYHLLFPRAAFSV